RSELARFFMDYPARKDARMTAALTTMAKNPSATRLPIAAIKIGSRHRKDLGDLEALAASLAALGQLQPIAVRPDGRLVAGQRRLVAAQQLGWETIAVHIVEGLDDAISLLRAERDENTCRKDFVVSEKVALGQRLEELERKAARQRQKNGGSNGG